MPVVEKERSSHIACTSSYGPSFGKMYWDGGQWVHSLCIANNANTSRSSYGRLGKTYKRPNKKQGDIFLTGTKEFIVADYEVFELY